MSSTEFLSLQPLQLPLEPTPRKRSAQTLHFSASILMQTDHTMFSSRDTVSRKTVRITEEKTSDDSKMESDRRRLQGWQTLIGREARKKANVAKLARKTQCWLPAYRDQRKYEAYKKECVRVSLDHFHHGYCIPQRQTVWRGLFPS